MAGKIKLGCIGGMHTRSNIEAHHRCYSARLIDPLMHYTQRWELGGYI
jgi:hypothetical protein